ncbi:protein kinase, partial [Pseudofrankia sp. BMG5.36]|uniref:WD40 repeat domain-containing serine/threonine protein kinase n=3 Tax=unclassified Pseudofrankia TaxID=2994372 RepID=UPI001F517FB5
MEPLDESDPRTFGPYQVLGRLGDGGMGTVYLAQRDGTGPLVAVKAIRADLARVPEFRGRFQREAEAAKRVARSFTAPVLDVATTGTRPYLVTEYIEGPTLTAAVRDRGPLPPADLEWLATAVASALRAIHAAGVIHRDLKPSNILLSRFGARVIDFGIARAPDATTMMTQGAIGTPAFMAPEQALDQPVTTAADIHAWGAVLAYAAAGHAPFDGASLPRILLRVVHDQPDLTGVPANLRPLVARAMAKNPADRPTADDLLDVLQHLHTPANDTPTITGPRVTPPRFVVPQITPPPVAPPWVTAPPTTGHTPPGPTTPPSPVAATAGSNIAPPPRGPVPLLPQAAAPTPGSVEDEAPARVGPLAPPYATAQPLQPPAPPHPRRRPLRRGPAIAIATTAALGVAAAVTAAVLTTRHPAPAAQPLASSTTHAPTTMPSRPTPLGKPLTGPTDKVTSVAFSPDGHTLAAGSNDTTVRLWNVTNPASP